MRILATAFALVLILLTGCRSSVVEDKIWTARQDGIAYAYSAVIPLPETTPFDSDPTARTAFLSAYQDGYRSGLTQFNINFGRPHDGFATYRVARTQGLGTRRSKGRFCLCAPR